MSVDAKLKDSIESAKGPSKFPKAFKVAIKQLCPDVNDSVLEDPGTTEIVYKGDLIKVFPSRSREEGIRIMLKYWDDFHDQSAFEAFKEFIGKLLPLLPNEIKITPHPEIADDSPNKAQRGLANAMKGIKQRALAIALPEDDAARRAPMYFSTELADRYLHPLSKQDAFEFVRKPIEGTNVIITNDAVDLISDFSGSNPKIMARLCAELVGEKPGDHLVIGEKIVYSGEDVRAFLDRASKEKLNPFSHEKDYIDLVYHIALTPEEQTMMRDLTGEKKVAAPAVEPQKAILNRLLDSGFVVARDGYYRVNGELAEHVIAGKRKEMEAKKDVDIIGLQDYVREEYNYGQRYSSLWQWFKDLGIATHPAHGFFLGQDLDALKRKRDNSLKDYGKMQDEKRSEAAQYPITITGTLPAWFNENFSSSNVNFHPNAGEALHFIYFTNGRSTYVLEYITPANDLYATPSRLNGRRIY